MPMKKIIPVILLAVAMLCLSACTQEPTWTRVDSTSSYVEAGDFSVEVGKNWEHKTSSYDTTAGFTYYYPHGTTNRDCDVKVMSTNSEYADWETILSMDSLDDQYEYLQSKYFIDGNYLRRSLKFTSIEKGTIGGYACIKGEFEAAPEEGKDDLKGLIVTFFTSPSTFGLVEIYYKSDSSDYLVDVLQHVADSVQLRNGSTPVYTGSMSITPSTVDKTELAALLAEANQLNESDYTPETWAIFSTALKRANLSNESESSEQKSIAWRIFDLRMAIEHLEPVANPPVVVADETAETGEAVVDEVAAVEDVATEEYVEPEQPAVVYGEGTYKVGVDLPAGEYRVTLASDFGYWEVKDSSAADAGLVGMEVVASTSYVTVVEGQYLTLSGCTASLA